MGDQFSSGQTISHYRIISKIGQGGMGAVYKAEDTKLRRPVALKFLLREKFTLIDKQRFLREAQAAAALHHPNICTIYEVDEAEGEVFFAMAFLEGDTLAKRLAQGPVPFDRVLVYAKEIASALNHAHSNGIIHRDLKPANIMLTAGGAKLLDFGLAKFRTAAGQGLDEADQTHSGNVARAPVRMASVAGMDSHLTRGDAILGTVRYMAPEQITGHEVDARSDLFSFGAVLFEMLTGRRAFDGDNVANVFVAVLEREQPSPSSLQPLVPPAIDTITRRCLAKNPDERWQTAGDLFRELERVSDTNERERPRTRAVWKWVAAIVLAMITGFASWLFTGRLQDRSAPPTTAGEIRSPTLAGSVSVWPGVPEKLIATFVTPAGAVRSAQRDAPKRTSPMPKTPPAIRRIPGQTFGARREGDRTGLLCDRPA